MPANRSPTWKTLHAFAAKLPDVEEGIACAGTALESRTLKTAKKAFLFLRRQDARFKLGASFAAAQARAKREPGRVTAGSGGWMHVRFDDATDDLATLKRWIAESHALYAPSATGGSKSPRGSTTAPRAPAKKRRSTPKP